MRSAKHRLFLSNMNIRKPMDCGVALLNGIHQSIGKNVMECFAMSLSPVFESCPTVCKLHFEGTESEDVVGFGMLRPWVGFVLLTSHRSVILNAAGALPMGGAFHTCMERAVGVLAGLAAGYLFLLAHFWYCQTFTDGEEGGAQLNATLFALWCALCTLAQSSGTRWSLAALVAAFTAPLIQVRFMQNWHWKRRHRFVLTVLPVCVAESCLHVMKICLNKRLAKVARWTHAHRSYACSSVCGASSRARTQNVVDLTRQ